MAPLSAWPYLGVSGAWPFVSLRVVSCSLEGRKRKGGEKADPGGPGRRLEEQLKRGGPRRPFVLRHLCAEVLGVEPKKRYLDCVCLSKLG